MSIYRVAVRGTAALQQTVNVWHLSGADGLEQDIAGAWIDTVQESWLGAMNAAYALNDITVTNLATHAQRVVGLTGSGDDILSEMMSPQSAAVISWKTGLAGRKYRGRTYIGGMGEDKQNAGSLLPAYKLLLGSIAGNLWPTWPNNCQCQMVIYHRKDGTSTPVNAYVIRDYVYSQRHRTIGRGV